MNEQPTNQTCPRCGAKPSIPGGTYFVCGSWESEPGVKAYQTNVCLTIQRDALQVELAKSKRIVVKLKTFIIQDNPDGAYCLFCDSWPGDGHKQDCELQAVLNYDGMEQTE